MTEKRYCQSTACRRRLFRREGETPKEFSNRKCCDRSCSAKFRHQLRPDAQTGLTKELTP